MRAADRERVAGLLGHPVTGAEPVHGGYTPAERWRVELADGTAAFVKIAGTPFTVRALRAEIEALTVLDGSSFAPRLRAADRTADRPLLIVEDLSEARWPPPWEPGDLDRVRAASEALAAADLPLRPADMTFLTRSWSDIVADPDAFLSTRLATREWLEAAAPALVEAAAGMPTAPEVCLHQDLRGDNLCFDGPRVVMVDWPWACRGPAGLDLACMAPSVRLEGGPLPDAWVGDAARFAAAVAGFVAGQAGLAPIPDAPRVRPFQHRQARIALAWAARVVGVPPPDGDWCARSLAERDAAQARGELDHAAWAAWTERDLVDAYLATDDPHRGSGKSGGAVDWRWSRELLLDAVPYEPAHILDVGAANGLLVQSLAQWAEERGQRVVVHGLEISERLTHVARRRVPEAAERLHVGDVLTWVPPRRYDLVHLGLDYVPSGSRRALLDRVFADLLTPGGRIVLRAARAGGPDPDPVAELRGLGFDPTPLTARHPHNGLVRITGWVARPAP